MEEVKNVTNACDIILNQKREEWVNAGCDPKMFDKVQNTVSDLKQIVKNLKNVDPSTLTNEERKQFGELADRCKKIREDK
jgi:CO dehydrogenase/acetyl-CoA synthase alpha subunit